jgi:parallel beta-helix repeat protein
LIVWATGVVLSDNYISDNGNYGIKFMDQAVKLRRNVLNNNAAGPFHRDEFSVSVSGAPFQVTSSDIDSSNLVDGKPVYYWVNEKDRTIPSNAGYVFLYNCTNITVKDLSINRNSFGRFVYGSSAISLIRTRNSVLVNNVLNGTEIYVSYSSQDIQVANNTVTVGGIFSLGSNVSIVGNSVSSSKDIGISLGGGSNSITRNTLIGCETGISLQGPGQNRIFQNSIVECGTGISIFSSDNNRFYYNNFINNTIHVSEQHYTMQWPLDTYYQSFNNSWIYNFWSDYKGIDVNGDGIGDSAYLIYENYTDKFPLIAPFDIDSVSIESPLWESASGTSPEPQLDDSEFSSEPQLENPEVPSSETDAESEPFPTVPVLAASAILLAGVVGAVVIYFVKLKKRLK